MTITDYKELFTHLPVNRANGKIAPHKAILLLTVLDMIDSGEIDTSFIPLTTSLENKFKENWEKHVPSSVNFTCSMHYPFFHLSSSPFWRLVKLPSYEERKEYSSMASLSRSFAGATIDDELYSILRDSANRKVFMELLINNYITNHKSIVPIKRTLPIMILALFAVA
ncbi:MAG: hypothetical protein NC102_00490 [Clostridium sp.]|nr:hypothetical protein [Clostridium sp.]